MKIIIYRKGKAILDIILVYSVKESKKMLLYSRNRRSERELRNAGFPPRYCRFSSRPLAIKRVVSFVGGRSSL